MCMGRKCNIIGSMHQQDLYAIRSSINKSYFSSLTKEWRRQCRVRKHTLSLSCKKHEKLTTRGV